MHHPIVPIARIISMAMAVTMNVIDATMAGRAAQDPLATVHARVLLALTQRRAVLRASRFITVLSVVPVPTVITRTETATMAFSATAFAPVLQALMRPLLAPTVWTPSTVQHASHVNPAARRVIAIMAFTVTDLVSAPMASPRTHAVPTARSITLARTVHGVLRATDVATAMIP